MIRHALILTLLLLASGAVDAATVNVFGGNLALESAWDHCVPGTTIVITDSLTYNQSHGWNAFDTSHTALVLMASPGQTPTILLNVGAASVGIALNSDVSLQIGSNAGGRITIDCGDPVLIPLYSNGDPKALTVENVRFLSTGANVDSHIVFYGTSAGTHTLTVDNCRLEGAKLGDGSFQVWEGASNPAVHEVHVTSCTWDGCKRAIHLRGGDDHAGDSTRSIFTIDDCRILNTQANNVWMTFYGNMFDVTINHLFVNGDNSSTGVLGDLGYGTGRGVTFTLTNSALINAGLGLANNSSVTVNHCDLVSNGNPISLVQFYEGTAHITNSNFLNNSTADPHYSMADSTNADPVAGGSPTLVNDYNNCPQGYQGKWVAGAHDMAVDPLYVSFPDDLTVQALELIGTANDFKNIGSEESQAVPPVNRVAHWNLY
jgi:hypothetical protein